MIDDRPLHFVLLQNEEGGVFIRYYIYFYMDTLYNTYRLWDKLSDLFHKL